jgi:3-hydroxyisobutyryl-CoA hydrolase
MSAAAAAAAAGVPAGLQVKQAGLATHFIPSSHLHKVKQQLQQAGPAASDLAHVNNILTDIEAAAKQEAGAAAAAQQQSVADALFAKLPIINRCFGKASVAQIAAALQAEAAEQEWCREALQQLQR